MADPAPHIDPHLRIYLPVPAAGPGVCEVCHAGPGGRQRICQSCQLTMVQVSRPTGLVVPVSLYQTPSDLWHVLRYYKDGDPRVRAAFTLQVAAVLARFTARHMGCLARLLGGRPDIVTTVPSTRVWPARADRHPLQTAVTAVTSLSRLHVPLLTPGTAAADHGQAADCAFRVAHRLRQERVLVIDDTLTTGARAQSAASALHLGGASRVAVLAVGRAIWPDWNDNCRRIWDRAHAHAFSFDTCCLCDTL